MIINRDQTSFIFEFDSQSYMLGTTIYWVLPLFYVGYIRCAECNWEINADLTPFIPVLCSLDSMYWM